LPSSTVTVQAARPSASAVVNSLLIFMVCSSHDINSKSSLPAIAARARHALEKHHIKPAKQQKGVNLQVKPGAPRTLYTLLPDACSSAGALHVIFLQHGAKRVKGPH
jgi:hypothetical protein